MSESELYWDQCVEKTVASRGELRQVHRRVSNRQELHHGEGAGHLEFLVKYFYC